MKEKKPLHHSVCSSPPIKSPFQLSRLCSSFCLYSSLSNSHFSLFESPKLMPMLPLTSSLFWKYVSPAYVSFFALRLEVCGMRLKDRFLTHGGLAL